MSRLRIFYLVSLGILALLIAFTIFRPMATRAKYSEVQREQLLQTEEEWIIQFDIINREGRDINYTIALSVDGQPSSLTVSVLDERFFTYIRRIRRDLLTSGIVALTVLKEGEVTPIEQATYYLK